MALVASNGMMRIGDTQQDQVPICQSALTAKNTGNAAAPGLQDRCGAARRVNVAAGNLKIDAMAPDADLRVALTDTGEHIIAGTPALTAIANKLTPDVRRGYAIGVKVASAIGGYDPSYAAWISAGMSSANIQGFQLAITGVPKGGNSLSAQSVQAAVKAAAPAASSGIPTAVYVGGGIVAVVGVGALLYKFVL